MKRIQSILCASLLTLAMSSVALAGDIYGRTSAAPGDIYGRTSTAPGDIYGRTSTAPGDIYGLTAAILGLLTTIVP